MTIAERATLKLEGKLLKYTVLVLLVDGRHVEVQTNDKPAVRFHDPMRATILQFGYSDDQVFQMQHVAGWTLAQNTSTA